MNIFDSRNLLHVLLWNLFKDEVGTTIVICFNCRDMLWLSFVSVCFLLISSKYFTNSPISFSVRPKKYFCFRAGGCSKTFSPGWAEDFLLSFD